QTQGPSQCATGLRRQGRLGLAHRQKLPLRFWLPIRATSRSPPSCETSRPIASPGLTSAIDMPSSVVPCYTGKSVIYSRSTPLNGLTIARERIAREAEERTGFLDLGRLGLSSLPDELLALKHLRGLNLGRAYYDEKHARGLSPHP